MLHVSVDGVDVPLNSLWVHFQIDPFPGCHAYHAMIPRRLIEGWMQELSDADIETPTVALAEEGLWNLQDAIAKCLSERALPGAPTQYVLNSIDRIIVKDDGVELFGACSPFLGQS